MGREAWDACCRRLDMHHIGHLRIHRGGILGRAVRTRRNCTRRGHSSASLDHQGREAVVMAALVAVAKVAAARGCLVVSKAVQAAGAKEVEH